MEKMKKISDEQVLQIPLRKDLAKFVNQQLSDYYGKDFRQIISSDGRARFINWLAANEGTLLQEFRADFAKGAISIMKYDKNAGNTKKDEVSLFGFWLAGKFLVSEYAGTSNHLSFPKINVFSGSILGSSYSTPKKTLIFDPEQVSSDSPFLADSFARGFNMGVHEYSHILPTILSTNAKYGLSETAAVLAQITYALPIKSSTANDRWYAGSRFLPHTLKEFSSGRLHASSTKFLDEYLASAIAPYIRKYFLTADGKPDLLKFEAGAPSSEVDIAMRLSSLKSYGLSTLKTLLAEDAVLNRFVLSEGIKNAHVVRKLKNVFKNIAAWSNTNIMASEEEFFKYFNKILSEQFGKPVGVDVPDTYVFKVPAKIPSKTLG